jgi:hypothetical protein
MPKFMSIKLRREKRREELNGIENAMKKRFRIAAVADATIADQRIGWEGEKEAERSGKK